MSLHVVEITCYLVWTVAHHGTGEYCSHCIAYSVKYAARISQNVAALQIIRQIMTTESAQTTADPGSRQHACDFRCESIGPHRYRDACRMQHTSSAAAQLYIFIYSTPSNASNKPSNANIYIYIYILYVYAVTMYIQTCNKIVYTCICV